MKLFGRGSPVFFLLFFQINWKSLLILHKRKTAQSCICAQWCWSLYLYSAYSNDHPLYKQGKAITISLSKHCTNISEALLSTIWHLSSHQNHEKKPGEQDVFAQLLYSYSASTIIFLQVNLVRRQFSLYILFFPEAS